MAIAGKGGTFKVGTNAVMGIETWKLDIDTDLKDTTNFSSAGWKEQTPTIKSWSGSISGQWNVSTDTNGQKALQDAFLSSTSVSAEFNVNGTNKYTGTAYIKKVSVEEPVNDIVKFSVDLDGTGALAYA
jgi:predicted secreted protein